MSVIDRFKIVRTIACNGPKKVLLLEEKAPPYAQFIAKIVAPGNDELSLRLLREFDILESLFEDLPEACHFLSAPVMGGENETTGEIYTIYQKISGESVSELIKRKSYLDESFDDREIMQFFKESLGRLLRLHGKGVVHLDLSPANIIMKNDGGIAFIDFEEAMVLKEEKATVQKPRGTSGYMAPELVERREVSRGSDVFALGRILQEMYGLNRRRISRSIRYLDKLCQQMTAVTPAMRPSILEVLDLFDRRQFEGKKWELGPWKGRMVLAASIAAVMVLFNSLPRRIGAPLKAREDRVATKSSAPAKQIAPVKAAKKAKSTKKKIENTSRVVRSRQGENIPTMPKITARVPERKKAVTLDQRTEELKKIFENHDPHFKFKLVQGDTYYFVSSFSGLDRMNCDWMSASIMRVIGSRNVNIIILPSNSNSKSRACQVLVGGGESENYEIILIGDKGRI